MAMKIRLARGGSKKRPFYRIVAADSRMPRDGRFIEKLGTYNPLLAKDSEDRVKMNIERIKHWMDLGAKPTDRVSRMLEAAGVIDKKTRNNPKKGEPHAKTKERVLEKADKAAAAKDAEKEAAAAPAPVPEDAPAEEVSLEQAETDQTETAEDAAGQDAAGKPETGEAATDEAQAKDASTEESPAKDTKEPAAE